jgi:hypothetical protein
MATVQLMLADMFEPGIRKIFANATTLPTSAYNLSVRETPTYMGIIIEATTRINGHKYGKAIRIDRAMIEDQQYNVIQRSVECLAKSMERSIEKGMLMGSSVADMIWIDEADEDIVIPRDEIRQAISDDPYPYAYASFKGWRMVYGSTA